VRASRVVISVLEGSVRRLGEQVQVNVQLVKAETAAHLWADHFDTDRTNLAVGGRVHPWQSVLAHVLVVRVGRGCAVEYHR
jgi:hypothetical protein